MLAPLKSPTTVRATRRYQPLVVVFAAVCAGIVVDRRWDVSFAAQMAGAVLCGGGWWWFRRRGDDRAACAALLCMAAAVGGAWHHACWCLFDVDDVAAFADVEARPIVLEGVLLDAPRVVEVRTEYDRGQAEVKTRFSVEVVAIRSGAGWRRAAGRCDVQFDDRVEAARAGDRVRILGRVSRSAPPLNPGEFDFAAHYRAERKLCVVRGGKADGLTVVAPSSRWNLAADFAHWRRRGHEMLLAHVPAAQAGFASALLLGYRDQLDRRENLSFFRTGTVHILIFDRNCNTSKTEFLILFWYRIRVERAKSTSEFYLQRLTCSNPTRRSFYFPFQSRSRI
jgi:hypothetical protein